MGSAPPDTSNLLGGHVIIFPFPAAGHIAPFIPFARTLAGYGAAITFFCPHNELSRLKRSLTEDESFDARQNIKLVSFEVPTEEGVDKSLIETMKLFMYGNSDKFADIVGQFMVNSATRHYPSHCDCGPPVCIISDMFLGFTQGIAEKFGIVRYCLFASPVHFLSLIFHLPTFVAEGLIPTNRNAKPLLLPNFPPVPPGDLPPSQRIDEGDPDSYQFLFNEGKQLWKSAGVLVNSVYEVEFAAIEGLQHYLLQGSTNKQPPRILTVGPLVEGLGEGKTPLRQKLRAVHERGQCLDWLSQQPDASVLYLCFGSVAKLSDEQIREIATGLQHSGHRFFWVLRISKDESGKPMQDLSQLLPEGFLESTKSRGLVYLDWAPQLHILANRAVRGFVTHCGWNSTLEGILVGVPMIAWPQEADQMMNATLLDQVLGIAIRINKYGHDLIKAEVFETAIRRLMEEPVGDAMRNKVMEISSMIEKAVRAGGSSKSNLDIFVQEVRGLKTGSSFKS